MSTITVPRSDISAEEVSAVIRRELGPRYTVTPSMKATGFGKEVPGAPNSLLVAANRLDRANLQITFKTDSTEIEVTPGATYFGLIRLVQRASLARKVRQALEHAPEVSESS